jgi:hypothetical protein
MNQCSCSQWTGYCCVAVGAVLLYWGQRGKRADQLLAMSSLLTREKEVRNWGDCSRNEDSRKRVCATPTFPNCGGSIRGQLVPEIGTSVRAPETLAPLASNLEAVTHFHG